MTAAHALARRQRRPACALLAAVLAWYATIPAVASEPEEAQVVTVQALRDVDAMPYRRILEGAAIFDRHHGLAPAAALRYRLYPRAPGASFDGLTVTLAAGKTEIPIGLDEHQAFSLPSLPALAREDALVMTNKKDGTYAWRVDIRTPGLPPNTRRLGDLRLECMVDMQGARLRRIVMTPPLAAMNAASDICANSAFQNPFFAERPVFDVTLVHGTRRAALAGEWLYVNSEHLLPEAAYALADWRYTRDRQYMPPIADAGWPDDTLIEFEYMDDDVAPPGPAK